MSPTFWGQFWHSLAPDRVKYTRGIGQIAVRTLRKILRENNSKNPKNNPRKREKIIKVREALVIWLESLLGGDLRSLRRSLKLKDFSRLF